MAEGQNMEGLARMAAARLYALGLGALDGRDVAALLAHPDLIPSGYTAADLPGDAPERLTGPTIAQRATGSVPVPEPVPPGVDDRGLPADMRPAHAGVPEPVPQFDGATYRQHRDYERLGAQARRVWDAMSDGAWHTLAGLHEATGDPEASISARLRDFRKEAWGGNQVEHRNLGAGTWEYRLAPTSGAGDAPP